MLNRNTIFGLILFGCYLSTSCADTAVESSTAKVPPHDGAATHPDSSGAIVDKVKDLSSLPLDASSKLVGSVGELTGIRLIRSAVLEQLPIDLPKSFHDELPVPHSRSDSFDVEKLPTDLNKSLQTNNSKATTPKEGSGDSDHSAVH